MEKDLITKIIEKIKSETSNTSVFSIKQIRNELITSKETPVEFLVEAKQDKGGEFVLEVSLFFIDVPDTNYITKIDNFNDKEIFITVETQGFSPSRRFAQISNNPEGLLFPKYLISLNLNNYYILNTFVKDNKIYVTIKDDYEIK